MTPDPERTADLMVLGVPELASVRSSLVADVAAGRWHLVARAIAGAVREFAGPVRIPEGRVLFVRWRDGGWQACGTDGTWRRYSPAEVPALAAGRTHVAVVPHRRVPGDDGPCGVFPIAGWLAGED